jgi:hypothetical protein
MKLEWGRKIYCPSCAMHFYDLRRTKLMCPVCNREFDKTDLTHSKQSHVAVDDDADVEDKAVITDFEFDEETIDIDLSDDSDELAVKTEIDEIKFVDEE